MNFRRANIEEPELNLIPLIDVMLVLLIFLAVSTTYSRFTQLQIVLPSARTAMGGSGSSVRRKTRPVIGPRIRTRAQPPDAAGACAAQTAGRKTASAAHAGINKTRRII